MLIKVQKASNSLGYIIFEKLSNVVYEIYPRDFDTYADVYNESLQVPGMLTHIFLYDGPAPSKAKAQDSARIKVNLITYTDSEGRDSRIFFDGEAFICNDDGKTIQKVVAV